VRSYHLESREFQVRPWTGITVDDLRSSNGVVSFRVGPRHTYDVPRAGGGAPVKAEIGPIDYPDSYASSPLKARYIDPHRHFFRDPAAPNDPSMFEWYCRGDPENDVAKRHGCSFRPWADTGDAARATVTFVSPGGAVHRAPAHEANGRWVADRRLGAGEAAYVESGDVCDRWNDYNGAPSGTVGRPRTVPGNPPPGYSCLPKGPPGGGAWNGRGWYSGLPAPGHGCVDTRRLRVAIHKPAGRRIVAVNVYVDGRRTIHKQGAHVTQVTMSDLPQRSFTLKIVAVTNRGERASVVRRYRGCKRPRSRVHDERHGGSPRDGDMDSTRVSLAR
jgi:hypothetical protein